jgi:hypothetical protein
LQREEGDAAQLLKTGGKVLTEEEGEVREITSKATLPHKLQL